MEASSSPQSTTPPLILEEPVVFIHPPIFEEPQTVKKEPPRVTLGDYSSSTMPQFTSIKRPNVQVANISY